MSEKLNKWLHYWYKKYWNDGVFPDEIPITLSLYRELLELWVDYLPPYKFLGRRLKIINGI